MNQIDDLMDPSVQSCPYGLYERLRDEAPVCKLPNHDIYLVTSFELCVQVMQSPELFASGVSPMAIKPGGIPDQVINIYSQEGWLPTASCSTSDPPRHTWVRALLKKFFPTSKVRAMIPYIKETAETLVAEFSGDGKCEFVQDFAHPLPMMVIADQLGVPSEMLPSFKRWSDAIVEPFSMMITPEREIECARLVVEMQHFFKNQLHQRKGQSGTDLLSICANASDDRGNPIGLNELLSIVTIDLLASGNETTTAAIASGMLKLAENPVLVKKLRSNPRYLRAFVEEVLRLEAPAQGMFRRVTRRTKLGGIELDNGAILSLRFGSANRDKSAFPNAAEVNLTRKAVAGHLAFGRGRHFCIGAPLARQEMMSSFEVLLDRLDNFALEENCDSPEYTPSFFGRNLKALSLKFDRIHQ